MEKQKPHKCTFEGCKARFSRPSKLQLHERQHRGERPFKCKQPDCDKSYVNGSHLKRHIQTAHREKNQYTHKCKICHLSVHNATNLKRHIARRHNPDRLYPYSCEECKQGFYKKHQLVSHRFIHTGEPAYTCEMCQRRFVSRYELKRHTRSHKIYSCTCVQTFNNWSTFLAHKKLCHSKQFICKVCSKEFVTQANLNSHTNNVHNDVEKEFMCIVPDCTRTYQYKRNMHQHIKQFHEAVKYICAQSGCGKQYSTKRRLNVHVKTHTESQIKKPRKPNVGPRSDAGVLQRSTAVRLTGLDGLIPRLSEKILVNNDMLDITDDVLLMAYDLTDSEG